LRSEVDVSPASGLTTRPGSFLGSIDGVSVSTS
jgi:hypothetical protein